MKSKIVSLAIFAMTIPQVSAQAPETSILYNLWGTFAICSRGGPINAQVLRNIFVAWVETDPKRKTEPMNESALNAIQAAWPCRPR